MNKIKERLFLLKCKKCKFSKEVPEDYLICTNEKHISNRRWVRNWAAYSTHNCSFDGFMLCNINYTDVKDLPTNCSQQKEIK